MEYRPEYSEYVAAVRRRGKNQESLYSHAGLSRAPQVIRCADVPPSLQQKFLDRCPVSDGPLYEHFVVDALGAALKGIVDTKNVLMHGPCGGGFFDIEFPFCCEMLPQFPFWDSWARRHEIKSIIVEAKNLSSKADVQHANQLKAYLDAAKKGSFGILVCRNGFTLPAFRALRRYVDDDKVLMLPLSQRDLKILLRLTSRNPLQVMRFLRRKETLLLRIW